MLTREFKSPSGNKDEELSPILPNRKQQNAILGILGGANFDLISQPDVHIEPERRRELMMAMAKGEINDKSYKEILQQLYFPNPSIIFKDLAHNRRAKVILATLLYGDPEQAESLTPSALARFTEAFPDPYSLDQNQRLAQILAQIEYDNGENKRQEYEKEWSQFLSVVYGKRYEYWVQMQLIFKEARDLFEKSVQEMSKDERKRLKIKELNDSESEELLKNSSIHGDLFRGKRLTVGQLKKMGLEPRFKLNTGFNSFIAVSKTFDLGHNRIALIAYVSYQGQTVARSYYRSNSMGLWRYLPKYLVTKEGEIRWYDKGHSEESITLPSDVQKSLADISSSTPLQIEDPSFALAGTARDVFRDRGGTYNIEVETDPVTIDGNFYPEPGDKIEPEKVDFRRLEDRPNFSKILDSWEQTSLLYGGNIQIELFSSNNGKFQFMFCTDKMGRVWIGGIETNGKIRSIGLKDLWVKGGDLTTPAFEYWGEGYMYANQELTNGNYVDMYKNYISKIPVIQEYLKIKSGA